MMKIFFFILLPIAITTSLLAEQEPDQRLFIGDFLRERSLLTTSTAQEIPEETSSYHEPLCTKKTELKEITVMTYMSAKNDLAFFARGNLSQQADVGSNDMMNIVTQLDTYSGKTPITKRYYVEKNKLIVMNNNDPASQAMDSGDPETLISFCAWAIKNFPAKRYVLVLWNHGTGIIDLGRYKAINSLIFYYFNTQTNMMELDRTLSYLDVMAHPEERGICFDDFSGHYINNQGLEHALSTVCSKYLNNKKFDMVIFDACLMAMIEVGNILKNYTHYMLASQEVEPARGLNYQLLLQPFLAKNLSTIEFAQHVVYSYQKAYSPKTPDYTYSACDLTLCSSFEQSLNTIASLLLECLQKQSRTSVKDYLKVCRHKLFSIQFEEPSFIDAHMLLSNFLKNIDLIKLTDKTEETRLKQALTATLKKGLELIRSMVIANAAGSNLKEAKGISIYFPERKMHTSYKNTKFVHEVPNWNALVLAYLLL